MQIDTVVFSHSGRLPGIGAHRGSSQYDRPRSQILHGTGACHPAARLADDHHRTLECPVSLAAGPVARGGQTLASLEFPVAHALAFPIYLVCIAAFKFFWTTLLRCRTLISDQAGVTHSPIPVLQMWVLGYSLFTWTTVGGMILLINPDMCVTAIVLLAAALLLRMEIFPNAGWPLYVGFGICLG